MCVVISCEPHFGPIVRVLGDSSLSMSIFKIVGKLGRNSELPSSSRAGYQGSWQNFPLLNFQITHVQLTGTLA